MRKLFNLFMMQFPLCVSNPVENRRTFYNKLLDAHNHCRCIYVSKESKRVVSKILNINNADNLIINPLPSLNKDDLKKAYNIENIKNIDRQFILLNSSIVETKRVEKAIYYFLKSNLTKRNFYFASLESFITVHIVITSSIYAKVMTIYSY